MARVWISYDLGIDGDYDGMYQWLDEQEAVECGDSCASFTYDPGPQDLDAAIKSDLKASMKLRPRDRVYVVAPRADGKWAGRFLFGRRKRNPWAGFASSEETTTDEA